MFFDLSNFILATLLDNLSQQFQVGEFFLKYVFKTLQNFICKHTIDLEIAQRNKKKDKGEVYKMSR